MTTFCFLHPDVALWLKFPKFQCWVLSVSQRAQLLMDAVSLDSLLSFLTQQ